MDKQAGKQNVENNCHGAEFVFAFFTVFCVCVFYTNEFVFFTVFFFSVIDF